MHTNITRADLEVFELTIGGVDVAIVKPHNHLMGTTWDAIEAAARALLGDRQVMLVGREQAVATPALPDFISYDEAARVLTVYGIRYSVEMLESLGMGFPLNTPLQIVSREDGLLTLQRIEPPPAEQQQQEGA
jgi:hypothetical protein